MATKSISQLDSASTMALGDLLEIAEPNAQSVSGYTSKKISIGSQLAPYIQGTVQNASLNTTNKTLVGAINEVDSEGVKWSENNVLSAKNLIVFPEYTGGWSRTNNGITYTVNPDGSVFAQGKNTTNNASTFSFTARSKSADNDNNYFPNGKYIISGSPSGMSSSTFYLRAGVTIGGSFSSVGNEYTDDGLITINGDDFSNEGAYVGIAILVPSGSDLTDGVLFKPMLRLESIKDTTFEPYAMSNRKLTLDKLEGRSVAPIEYTNVASKAYSIGDYMIWRNELYKVTANISINGAITEGTNVTATTIGAELKALFSALA